MKRIFTPILFSVLFLSCSKDILKSYERRIVGTWRIADIKRVGFGGNTDNLAFQSGTFTFYENGTLEYVNGSNQLYKGSWDIRKKTFDEETTRSLQITAVDFNNQQVLTEYYDDMIFAGTDHFRANIVSGFHTYVTHFRR